VFFAFVIYPVGYALWMASEPSLYADLSQIGPTCTRVRALRYFPTASTISTGTGQGVA